MNVEKFPESSFASKRISRGDRDGHFSIVGDLTTYGVTHEIDMSAKISIETDRIRVDASFVLEQSKFGMNKTPGKPLTVCR